MAGFLFVFGGFWVLIALAPDLVPAMWSAPWWVMIVGLVSMSLGITLGLARLSKRQGPISEVIDQQLREGIEKAKQKDADK